MQKSLKLYINQLKTYLKNSTYISINKYKNSYNIRNELNKVFIKVVILHSNLSS